MLSMRLHTGILGLNPQMVIATGGGSANSTITQIMSNVFGTPVLASSQTDSASLGAALRALHGYRVRSHRAIFKAHCGFRRLFSLARVSEGGGVAFAADCPYPACRCFVACRCNWHNSARRPASLCRMTRPPRAARPCSTPPSLSLMPALTPSTQKCSRSTKPWRM